MTYSQLTNAVSFSSLKESALYFDRVIPINPIEFIRWDEPPLSNEYSSGQYTNDRSKQLLLALKRNDKLIGNLLFEKDSKNESLKSALEILCNYTKVAQLPSTRRFPQAYFNAQYVRHMMLPVQQQILANSYIEDENVPEIGVSVRGIISDICETFSVANPSVVLPSGSHANKNGSESSATESLFATVSGMGLIDTEKATWEQILEIRSDSACHLSLRRFRTAIFDSYIGKDESYIRDDIFLKMADYDFSVKKHGLDKSDSLISAVISSPNLGPAVVAAASGGWAAINGVASLAVGLFTLSSLPIIREIANVTIERRKANREMEAYHRTHPLSYIFDARKILS